MPVICRKSKNNIRICAENKRTTIVRRPGVGILAYLRVTVIVRSDLADHAALAFTFFLGKQTGNESPFS